MVMLNKKRKEKTAREQQSKSVKEKKCSEGRYKKWRLIRTNERQRKREEELEQEKVRLNQMTAVDSLPHKHTNKDTTSIFLLQIYLVILLIGLHSSVWITVIRCISTTLLATTIVSPVTSTALITSTITIIITVIWLLSAVISSIIIIITSLSIALISTLLCWTIF